MTSYLKPSSAAWLSAVAALLAGFHAARNATGSDAKELPASYSVKQLTSGPKHHFYGYQGHAGNTPWDGSNTKLLLLETDFQDRLVAKADAARITLVDEATGALTALTETGAWNFQQGAMLYWNPRNQSEEFFFNDRASDDKVKAVLYNMRTRKRRVFLFPSAPIGNSGVAQKGGEFLAFNYGRLARLRPVVGYAGASDWTAGVKHPANDGLWLVNVASGRPKLILSFKQIRDRFVSKYPELDAHEMFLNHSLWNRDDTRILLAARWYVQDQLKSIWMTLAPDGTDVIELLGNPGHLEWEAGEKLLAFYRPTGASGGEMSLVDTRTSEVLETFGADFFAGDSDLSLTPDLNWMARPGAGEKITFYSRAAKAGMAGPTVAREPYKSGFGEWNQDPTKRMYQINRIDISPCWNRDATKIYYFGLAPDGTRQAFVMTLNWKTN